MTITKLVIEIRRRAASLPHDLPRSIALEQAARDVLQSASTNQQQESARKFMAALLGIGDGQVFDAAILSWGRVRLDIIADRMLSLGWTEEAVRAIRAPLIRPIGS